VYVPDMRLTELPRECRVSGAQREQDVQSDPLQTSRTMLSSAQSAPSIETCASMWVLIWANRTRLTPIADRCSRRVTQFV
jgi:hypothetical protein